MIYDIFGKPWDMGNDSLDEKGRQTDTRLNGPSAIAALNTGAGNSFRERAARSSQ